MYDIVFISYNETNADDRYTSLKHQYPMAKRVHGIKGIHQAHIAAAKKCFTKMFWVVDADAIILNDFKFDYIVPEHQLDHAHVWRSKNPVNDLEYGNGGVKLLPRRLTIDMDITKTDMTTSISSKFKAMPEVANITAFNTDEYSTWRSAFRECAKLSSKIIDRQDNKETMERLETWCTKGRERRYGNFCIAGANAGKEFGLANTSDLTLINNFEWLHEQFSKYSV